MNAAKPKKVLVNNINNKHYNIMQLKYELC